MGGFRTLGLLLTLGGCLGLYLASPHQGWLRSPWPARPARVLGSGLLLCGLASLCVAYQAVPALLVFAVWVMLLLLLMPCLGALLTHMRTRP